MHKRFTLPERSKAHVVENDFRSSRERLKEELMKEKDTPGDLTQSFAKVATKLQNDRSSINSEDSSDSFEMGEFAFLFEEGDTPEKFYARLADYTTSEEAQNYWTLKNALEYAQKRPEKDQNDLIRLAINVFDWSDLLVEKIRPEDIAELKEISLSLLQQQVSNPDELQHLYDEIKKRDQEENEIEN